ncbi:MAG TPA: nitroreductase [Rhizobiaceae bacterium]|nr:nitroreductase [Rhizobiaceae bacterium]
MPFATVRAILDGARHAPSGGNLQPWEVYAVTGEPLARLLGDVEAKMALHPRGEAPQYRVYPQDLKQPWFDRRFKCGEDLYATIGVAREDKAGRLAQFRRNFLLFGAPVGLFVYLDRQMGPPQWADCGMFLQSLMLLACEHGLATCAQEAWAAWHETIAAHLDPPDEWMLFCGVALGFMDEDAPVNRLRTERAEVEAFVRFVGFG